MITSKLTSKAQTTIPQAVRNALHLKKGDNLVYRIEGESVILVKAHTSEVSDDPFATFDEWNSDADRRAYADLRSERVVLSERDSVRVLDLLENPPAPNAKLVAAAQALPRRR